MALTGKLLMGLKKVEMGDLASDGGRASVWTQHGYTAQDSCTMDTADPETTQIYAEEVDDPIYESKKGGLTTITFNIQNPSVDSLVKLCGGTKGSDGEWKKDGSLPDIEQSLKLSLTTGQTFIFPRCSIAAKFSGTIGKSDNLKLQVKATVLKPLKDGEPAMELVPPTE